MVGATKPHQPIQENVYIYREVLPIYIKMTQQLMETYDDIAAFQRKYEKREI